MTRIARFFDSPRTRFAFRAVGALGLTILITGCGATETPAEGEHRPPDSVVDVPPRIDVPIEDDLQEAPRRPQLVGMLPSDFPDDLPIYLPSSVVDLSRDGERWVELLSPSPIEQVRSSLRSRLDAAGWRVAADADGGYLLRLGERRARLTLSGGGDTTYRYEY